MKPVDNPVFRTAFDNGWAISVARVDDGDYRWSVQYTSPDGSELYGSFETALEIFESMSRVQSY